MTLWERVCMAFAFLVVGVALAWLFLRGLEGLQELEEDDGP
jgi:hypothetical protein